MLLPCTQQKLICPLNATYKPHMTISSCSPGHIYVSVYASYKPTAINSVNMNSGIHTSTLLVYAPQQPCMPYWTYVFPCTNTVVYI